MNWFRDLSLFIASLFRYFVIQDKSQLPPPVQIQSLSFLFNKICKPDWGCLSPGHNAESTFYESSVIQGAHLFACLPSWTVGWCCLFPGVYRTSVLISSYLQERLSQALASNHKSAKSESHRLLIFSTVSLYVWVYSGQHQHTGGRVTTVAPVPHICFKNKYMRPSYINSTGEMIAFLKQTNTKPPKQPHSNSSLCGYPLKMTQKEHSIERGDMSKPIRHAYANLENRLQKWFLKDKSEDKKLLLWSESLRGSKDIISGNI